jgi:hypothetical protein
MVPLVGSAQYGVADINDWKVTAHGSLDRGVSIATGTGWGHGVYDTSDATTSLQGGTVGSGSRWDLVVARRNWSGTGGATTFALIAGSSTKALPSRNTNPGTLDDQPIALVQFTAGQTAPTAIVDLRCWSRNGGMVANDTLALTYLTHLGGQVKINGALWTCVPNGGGGTLWSQAPYDGYIPLAGFGGSLEALTAPNSAAPFFRVQAGSSVAVSDGSGFGRVNFPMVFPNGLLTAILTNGDSSIDRSRGFTLTMAVAGQPWNTGSRADINYSVMDSNGNMVPGTLHRINWIAIGW